MLTCFDRLGQPAEWLDFGSWLKSKKHDFERNIIKPDPTINDIEMADLYYNTYTGIYGVKNSFHRFILEVIPNKYRTKLLNSIKIEKQNNPPELGQVISGTDNDKIKYLFDLRNEFTHKAKFMHIGSDKIWPEKMMKDVWVLTKQSFLENTWSSISVMNWPETIELTVKIGLVMYLKNILNKKVA
ncbi:MAG: hypothetical protein IIA61_14225 [Candidatus Marinimicrobia bacterium]|nr:hypothetical protein [Candidatus Neomarinimicrobiota bacterium]